jgi:hypothetical protein
MKKVDNRNQSSKALRFWCLGGLLAALLVFALGHDIARPFYGLHSWADAHSAWAARVPVKYGLGYTKGFSTRAVGYPPTENPYRYLDHPQLSALLNAAAMAVLGIHTWSLRAVNIIATIITLLLFLKILRGLLDDKTALLAGLFFCLFPVIGYFGVPMWLYPLTFLAILCYLKLIKEIESDPKRKTLYSFGLAFGLFFALQVSWEGFFFAMAIGIHYLCRCIHRRTFPAKSLLAILIIAPLGSLALNFIIMAAGHGWDFRKIIDLYKWRAGAAEVGTHDWGDWFAKFWEFAQTNFTLPILIAAIAYLTIGQLFVFMEPKPKKKNKRRPRQFPQFWLFLMPPVFQLFLLKGCLWRHQTWERPFCFFIAIAAAQGVMLLADILKKANKYLAIAAVLILVGLFSVYSVIGTRYYYGIRWQAPAKIEMFEMLKKKIPPDKALLSFESFIVAQHKAKGAFYRPEIAWHLDRDIVVAYRLADIREKAKTGKYPFYLVPKSAPWSLETRRLVQWARQPNLTAAELARREGLARQARTKEVRQWQSFLSSLAKLYKYQLVTGEKGATKYRKFYRAGMPDYMIFDLSSTAG